MHVLTKKLALIVPLVLLIGCGGQSSQDLLKTYRERMEEKGEALTRNTEIQIQLLDKIVIEHAVPVAREMTSDKDAYIQHIGCVAAARLKDAKLVPQLISCLKNNDLYLSNEAAYALIKIGSQSVKSVMTECQKLLAKKKRSEQEDWALFHCFVVFRLIKAKKAVPLCIEALSDKSKKVRYAALGALKDIEAKEKLLQIAAVLSSKDGPPLLHLRAARTLAGWEAAEAAGDLIYALKDGSDEVRKTAAAAFKKIRAPKAVPALIEAVGDKSQKVSAEAVRALYFQTGGKVTGDFHRMKTERKQAQEKWRLWWQQQKKK